MVEMSSFPDIQVGNARISLCPICYELTFGFSSNPEEKLSGVKIGLIADTKFKDFTANDKNTE